MSKKFEGIITARPTWLGRFFWGMFSHRTMQVVFRKMVVEPEIHLSEQRSVLLIGNHVSWWDGFWALRLNQLYFKRKFYIMMLESQLQNLIFMRQGGAFSINPGKRSMITSLKYTTHLLENPSNIVVMYPQGKIHSLHEHEILFQPGVCKILDRVGDRTQVIFYAVHLDFMEYSRPYLHFRLQDYPYQKGTGIRTVNDDYQTFFEHALKAHREMNRV